MFSQLFYKSSNLYIFVISFSLLYFYYPVLSFFVLLYLSCPVHFSPSLLVLFCPDLIFLSCTRLTAFPFSLSIVGEVGRHIVRSVAYTILGPVPYIPNRYIAFERKMHLPTVKFLNGVLTVICLEGLYGKNMGMSQYLAMNLKVAVSPCMLE